MYFQLGVSNRLLLTGYFFLFLIVILAIGSHICSEFNLDAFYFYCAAPFIAIAAVLLIQRSGTDPAEAVGVLVDKGGKKLLIFYRKKNVESINFSEIISTEFRQKYFLNRMGNKTSQIQSDLIIWLKKPMNVDEISIDPNDPNLDETFSDLYWGKSISFINIFYEQNLYKLMNVLKNDLKIETIFDEGAIEKRYREIEKNYLLKGKYPLSTAHPVLRILIIIPFTILFFAAVSLLILLSLTR